MNFVVLIQLYCLIAIVSNNGYKFDFLGVLQPSTDNINVFLDFWATGTITKSTDLHETKASFMASNCSTQSIRLDNS